MVHGLGFYAALSRTPLRKSYLGKLFAVVFIGTSLPLFCLLGYLFFAQRDLFGGWMPITVLALATLAGTVWAWYALHALTAPIRLANRVLCDYVERREYPRLNKEYPDQAGQLLSNAYRTVNHLSGLLDHERERALTDPLTDLYNRYWCETQLIDEVAQARRERRDIVLAVLDLDDFKAVNDSYGHATGDACLRTLAQAAREELRAGDWIARWGGDEFIVLLHGSRENAQAGLERLRRRMEQTPVRVSMGDAIRLTLSAGAVQSHGAESADRLFQAADEALIAAKTTGRNRLVFHESNAKTATDIASSAVDV